MDMETKLTYSQRCRLHTLYWEIISLRNDLEKSNLPLNYGNGSVQEQLDCASAALDCIYQEYPF